MIKLWLDDVRPAPTNTFWVWVKDADEAITFLRPCLSEGKTIEVAQLDHDLGEMAFNFCPICREVVDNYNEWCEIMTHGCEHTKTGRTVVEWMKFNNYWPREIVIHSFNFEGTLRMASIAKDYTHVTIRPFSGKE